MLYMYQYYYSFTILLHVKKIIKSKLSYFQSSGYPIKGGEKMLSKKKMLLLVSLAIFGLLSISASAEMAVFSEKEMEAITGGECGCDYSYAYTGCAAGCTEITVHPPEYTDSSYETFDRYTSGPVGECRGSYINRCADFYYSDYCNFYDYLVGHTPDWDCQ